MVQLVYNYGYTDDQIIHTGTGAGDLLPNGLPVGSYQVVLGPGEPPPDPIWLDRLIKGANKFRLNQALGVELAVREPQHPWQIIYGKQRVGGAITFLTLDRLGEGEFLHFVVTFAAHKINKVKKVLLDGTEVEFADPSNPSGDATGEWFTFAWFDQGSNGDENQVANANLVAQSNALFPGLWTTSHRQRGHAMGYLRLFFYSGRFPNGMPSVQFEVEGHSEIYDPRDSTYKYTDNAALVIANYLSTTKRWGLGADYSTKINAANLIEAANICDETVAVAAGGTEKRYTINTTILDTETPIDVLQQFRKAIGGHIVYQSGQWFIYPAKWRAPSITLTESDVLSEIRVTTRQSRAGLFNTVKGSFIDAGKDFTVTDYPAVKNATYAADDGRESSIDLPQECVTSAATCQRLAKIELERARQQITVQATFSLKALQLQVPDVVSLTLSRFGWSSKAFEVQGWAMALIDTRGVGVELTLRETASGVFDWNSGEETQTDLAPDSNLPDPRMVLPPTGLTITTGTAELLLQGDGTVVSRLKAAWTLPADPYVKNGGFFEVQFKPTAEPNYTQTITVPGDQSYVWLGPVQDGALYDVQVRSVSAHRIAGDWVVASGVLVIGKTEPPSNVASLLATVDTFGIGLSWPAIHDVDFSQYVLRVAVNGGAPVKIFEGSATSFTYKVTAAASYQFEIYSVDTSGNSSTSTTTTTVVIAAPGVPTMPMAAFAGPDLVISWGAPTTVQFNISHYQIRYGSSYAGGTDVAQVKGTAYTLRATWLGTRQFWIAAVDSAGNTSTAATVSGVVTAPGVVTSLSKEVIDNNVILKWGLPATGSLPVESFKVYRGATFSGATLKGEVKGNFIALFESVASGVGGYTYWVVGVDTAGNVGTELGINAVVNQPPGFTLRADDQQNPFTSPNTASNLIDLGSGSFIFGSLPTQTFQQHFDAGDGVSTLWASLQAQIDAGYPYLLQPSNDSGVATFIIDYGTTLPATNITVSWVETTIAGAGTITCKIWTSTDGSTWGSPTVDTKGFGASFRYVKVELSCDYATKAGLIRIDNARVRLDVKITSETGSGTALASDASGTTFTFTKDFTDITCPPQVSSVAVIRAATKAGASGNYLSCADHTDFEPGNGDFVVAGWVKLMAKKPGSGQTLIGKWQTAGQYEWNVSLDDTGIPYFYVSNNGTTIVSVAGTALGMLPLGQWVFLAVYHNPTTDKIGVRVNKSPWVEASHSTGLATGTSRVELFSNAGGAEAYVSMRNWAYWAVGQTTAALDAIMDLGFCQYSELSSGQKTGMISYWELDESSGTRNDSHGSHHLTQTGTIAGEILPVAGLADFVDAPNPTDFKALLFADGVRASGPVSWFTEGVSL